MAYIRLYDRVDRLLEQHGEKKRTHMPACRFSHSETKIKQSGRVTEQHSSFILCWTRVEIQDSLEASTIDIVEGRSEKKTGRTLPDKYFMFYDSMTFLNFWKNLSLNMSSDKPSPAEFLPGRGPWVFWIFGVRWHCKSSLSLNNSLVGPNTEQGSSWRWFFCKSWNHVHYIQKNTIYIYTYLFFAISPQFNIILSLVPRIEKRKKDAICFRFLFAFMKKATKPNQTQQKLDKKGTKMNCHCSEFEVGSNNALWRVLPNDSALRAFMAWPMRQI